jgi:hypothetical protein
VTGAAPDAAADGPGGELPGSIPAVNINIRPGRTLQ